jgi:hypothetical protein
MSQKIPTSMRSDAQTGPKKGGFVKFIEDGTNELIDFRTQLATFSLKRAAMRINQQKIKRINVDPIQEEINIDEALDPITSYSIEATELGDTSSISRGVLSQDDSLYAIR